MAVKSGAVRKPGNRLSFLDRLQILDLHKKHPEWTFQQIADTCRCDWRTAQLTILAVEHGATELMAAYAVPLFRDWRNASRKASDRGDHRPAKDWLLHAGILDPLPETGRGTGTTINILNAPLPGTATTVTIDASDRQIPQNSAAPSAPSTLITSDDDNLGGS